MAEKTYHPLYLRGIEEFNRRNYFESHEIWEGLWGIEQGPARQFYQGLIQAAVALHHLGRGNAHGARKLLARSWDRLQPYRSQYLGLDVDTFLTELRECLAHNLCEGEGMATTQAPLASVPIIRLHRPPSLE